MTTTYDIRKIKAGLKSLKANKEFKGFHVTEIAAAEKCSTQTVYNYINGDSFAVPALAKAILERANSLLKQEQQ